MSLVTLTRPPTVSDAQQYKLLCLAIFPFFLAAVATRRVWRLGRRRPSGASWSVLAEARAVSANALLFAFQG